MIENLDRVKCVKLLEKGLEALGISPERNIIERVIFFVNELILWNKKINLIGTDVPEEIIVKHVFDSLAILSFLKDSGEPVVDLGPGGGFPSIPLSIVCANKCFVGVERRLKRASFLEYMVLRLGLKNYRVFTGDIRELEEKVPVVITRGVGTSLEIFQLTKHVLKPGGMLLLYKGKKSIVEHEINQLKTSLLDKQKVSVSVQDVRIPFLDEERSIVIIERE